MSGPAVREPLSASGELGARLEELLTELSGDVIRGMAPLTRDK